MYFSLDFGGTNFRISWLTSLNKIYVKSNYLVIKNTGNYQKDRDYLFSFMKLKSGKSGGITVALPGSYNDKKKVLEVSNNLAGWIGKPFFKQLESEFDCGVTVRKDVCLAGLGEGFYNYNFNQTFLYVSWGTGIGGCLVTRTERLPKITILDWESTFKKIETLCGGGHAVENYGAELKSLKNQEWDKIINNISRELVTISGKLNVKQVVLGGGVSDKNPVALLKIKSKLSSQGIRLEAAVLGDLSALYGGFILMSEMESNDSKI